jgi:signal recognition particle GTPase
MDGGFTLDDFITMMRQVETLPSSSINVSGVGDIDVRRQMCRILAVYDSMSRSERANPDLLDARRRRRISVGAGGQGSGVKRESRTAKFRELDFHVYPSP